MKSYDDIDSYDELVKFQRMMAKEYPYYPVDLKAWDKINEWNISVKGLEQLEILKRQTTMGNSTPEDTTLMVNLLELYASTNPTNENLKNWKKNLDFHFNTLRKTHYLPELVKEGLAIKNENYDPKFMKIINDWALGLIHRCHQLRREEQGKNL